MNKSLIIIITLIIFISDALHHNAYCNKQGIGLRNLHPKDHLQNIVSKKTVTAYYIFIRTCNNFLYHKFNSVVRFLLIVQTKDSQEYSQHHKCFKWSIMNLLNSIRKMRNGPLQLQMAARHFQLILTFLSDHFILIQLNTWCLCGGQYHPISFYRCYQFRNCAFIQSFRNLSFTKVADLFQ